MYTAATAALLVPTLFASLANAGKGDANYTPGNTPKQSEEGQEGTNQCGNAYDQSGKCQNAFINSVTDFCLWAPPEPGAKSTIGETERYEVAWCLTNGTGSRIIPDGAIKGVTFLQTPDFVQVTGVGDFTLLNIPKGDAGGELDPHGADGNGNPIGGLVFSSAFGQIAQVHEWTNFMAADQFCFRACKDGPNAAALCQHIYDEMGCAWNMPGNYKQGEFQSCKGDTGPPMGVYGGSTFHQGAGQTPPPHPAPSSSSCTPVSTVSNGGFKISGTAVTPPGPTTSGSAAAKSSQSAQANAQSSTNNSGMMITVSDKVIGTVFVGIVGLLVGAITVL